MTTDPLGLLQSRVMWFAIAQISQPLRLRAGLWQFRLFSQFVERLPIPEISPSLDDVLGAIAAEITELARQRKTLDQRSRHRINTDLGTSSTRLSQKLSTWWTLDFHAFRAEVKKVLRNEIPVRDRDDWEEWLNIQRAEHDRLTAEIVRLETELNAIVYGLFDLTPAEIELIEKSTGYRYGEV